MGKLAVLYLIGKGKSLQKNNGCGGDSQPCRSLWSRKDSCVWQHEPIQLSFASSPLTYPVHSWRLMQTRCLNGTTGCQQKT